MEVRRTRRIRISFSDPDATDSDSGEDASSAASCGSKTKIVILHCISSSSSSSAKKNPGGCGSQQRSQIIRSSSASYREHAVASSAPVMKRCCGVYERQPGRWAAEFRSHRLKARHWIGTFGTKEEATAAYHDFERQFVPARRCGLLLPLPALERGGRSAGVHRPSYPHGPHRQRHRNPPDTEKRQIVQALAATGIMLPPLPSATASAPCVSNSTPVAPPQVPAPPTPFENAEGHADAGALPSVHSFWADEPADEDLVGLADLGHLPLPFSSDGSMDFDPADLSLLDGFL